MTDLVRDLTIGLKRIEIAREVGIGKDEIAIGKEIEIATVIGNAGNATVREKKIKIGKKKRIPSEINLLMKSKIEQMSGECRFRQ